MKLKLIHSMFLVGAIFSLLLGTVGAQSFGGEGSSFGGEGRIGGGGGGARDKCPLGDNSDSYYDKSCFNHIVETYTGNNNSSNFTENEIYNSDITDGYCYNRNSNISFINSENIITSKEFKKALMFLYSYEVTSFNNIDKFEPYNNLTREDAAKMFSNFAVNVLCRKPDQNLTVNYTDITNSDPVIKKNILLAYQLGLMKGGDDEKFRPKDYITKAEFNAVLIRMILKGYLSENTTDIWYSEYNTVSSDLNIIKYGAGKDAIIRKDASLILFRAYKNQLFSLQDIGYKSFVLEDRNQFIK